MFKNRKVLDLNAGVGIAGIAVYQWTKCEAVAMTETRDEVIRNINRNCEKNLINKEIVIFRLNLAEY